MLFRNHGNTRISMCQICSKSRCIFRIEFKILAFGCWLFLQKSSIVDVQLGCKNASQVEDKDTRTMSLMLFWCLYCWLNTFSALVFMHVFYISHIFHILMLHCWLQTSKCSLARFPKIEIYKWMMQCTSKIFE